MNNKSNIPLNGKDYQTGLKQDKSTYTLFKETLLSSVHDQVDGKGALCKLQL
jgi:hypothetical protein